MKTILTTCLFFLWSITNAQVKVPEKIIGNWVNEQSNDWEYGFFENFVVYDGDFWEYEAMNIKKNGLEIKLRKGSTVETLKLTLPQKAGSTVIVARNEQRPVKFRLNRAGFFPYTGLDHKPFKNSRFKPDSVTIIGYYRNLAKTPISEGKGPFEVSVHNFILNKAVEYFADFDSMGRFKIKFPILNTQEVYLDWGRLTRLDVVEPGETIFLFADMDYKNSRAGDSAFNIPSKQILYMGKEARLHNELANYTASSDYFTRSEIVKKTSSDMEYLGAARANYQTRIKHLEEYIKHQPRLSDRFKEYRFAFEKYQLAFNLLQYRFDKQAKREVAFDEGYIEFIQSNMDFNDEKLFTLTREYSTFIRDYVSYFNNLKSAYKDEKTGRLRQGGIYVNSTDVLLSMENQGFFNEQEKEILAKSAVVEKIVVALMRNNDTTGIAGIMKQHEETAKAYQAIKERPAIKKALSELTQALLSKKVMEQELQQIDSLFQNKTLRELLIAKALCKLIDHERIPLSETALAILNERITSQPIKDYILDLNNQYIAIGNREIAHPGSLKNTAHLRESKDADSLFRQLIAPFKGKVIYVDFWGTWCGPCLQQMPFAGVIKKEFAGKEVFFMYLANNSPEKTWKNLIKQMELSGQNVVHYNLPSSQQSMIERKFSVSSFPTYMLVNKEGNISTNDAPKPQQKDELVRAINKLLAE